MSIHDFDWKAPGAVEQLEQLWRSGHSASQIAAKMGLSRNAVIGKCQRLGLTSATRFEGVKLIRKTYTFIRNGEAVQDVMPPRARAVKAPKVARAHVRPPHPGPQKKPALVMGATFIEGPASDASRAERRADGMTSLQRVESGGGVESPNARPFSDFAKGCKWPLGSGEDRRVCCNPQVEGRVYCAGHLELSLAKDQPDRIRARDASRLTRFDRVERDGPRPAAVERSLWDDGRLEAA